MLSLCGYKRIRQMCLGCSACILSGLLSSGFWGAALAQELPQPQPIIPVQAPVKDIILVPSVGLQEMFTDNVYVTANDREADLISRVFGGGTLDVNTGPTVAHIKGTASYDFYASASELDSWNLDFNGTGHYDLVPDFLSLQAEGSITQGYLSTYGTPAVERNDGANQLRLMNFDVGPRLQTQVLDLADLVVNARYAQVAFDNLQNTALPINLTDSSIYQATGRLDTADRLGAVQLVTSGEYLEDDHDFRLYNGLQTVYLRVLPLVRLIGRGGYESIQDPTVNSLNNPVWTVGVEYTPFPQSTISVEWGNRFNRPIWNVNAHVQLTDSLYATGRFLESVEPLNVRLNRSLTDILAQSETEPPFVSSQVFSLDQNLFNMTAFNEEASGRLVYSWAAQTVSVSASWLQQDFFQATATQNRQASMTASYQRMIRPDFSVTVKGYYAHTFASPLYGKNEVYQVGLSTNYALNAEMTLNGGYVYQAQQQFFTTGQSTHENVAFVSLAHTF